MPPKLPLSSVPWRLRGSKKLPEDGFPSPDAIRQHARVATESSKPRSPLSGPPSGPETLTVAGGRARGAASPPGFTKGAHLGAGKFAKVVILTDGTGSQVAAKIFHAGQQLEEDERLIMALASKDPHPNITRSFGATTYNGQDCLLMECVSGGTLRSIMDALAIGEDPHDVRANACKYLFHRTLTGLKHLHDRSIVHRDLKPENILWDEKTLQPKIADFGQAIFVGSPGAAAGTPPIHGT